MFSLLKIEEIKHSCMNANSTKSKVFYRKNCIKLNARSKCVVKSLKWLMRMHPSTNKNRAKDHLTRE